MQHRTLSLGQATRFEAQRVAMCLPCSGKMICLIFLNSGFMLVGLRFLGPILADCTGVRAHVSTETLHMKPVLPPALAKNIWNGESFLGCSRGDCYQAGPGCVYTKWPKNFIEAKQCCPNHVRRDVHGAAETLGLDELGARCCDGSTPKQLRKIHYTPPCAQPPSSSRTYVDQNQDPFVGLRELSKAHMPV